MNDAMVPCPRCRELNAKSSEECLFCGARLSGAPVEVSMPVAAPEKPMPSAAWDQEADGQTHWRQNDGPDPKVALISFLIPIVGLALYLHYSALYPTRAKSALKGFLSGLSFYFVLFLIFGKGPEPVPGP